MLKWKQCAIRLSTFSSYLIAQFHFVSFAYHLAKYNKTTQKHRRHSEKMPRNETQNVNKVHAVKWNEMKLLCIRIQFDWLCSFHCSFFSCPFQFVWWMSGNDFYFHSVCLYSASDLTFSRTQRRDTLAMREWKVIASMWQKLLLLRDSVQIGTQHTFGMVTHRFDTGSNPMIMNIISRHMCV